MRDSSMAWHKVILTREDIEKKNALSELEERFLQHFMKAEDNAEMALLSDDEYQGENISLYFSPQCFPACDSLIEHYSGQECPPPPREGVFVLAGDEDILDSLT